MQERLKELLNNSYAPYSNYPVAAVVVTNDGQTFDGVNVENASYGLTICAERNAILKAVTKGYRKGNFKELYVMVGSGKIATPCFACRQVMLEFFDKEDEVICMSINGDKTLYKVKDLCPYPFEEDDLK